MYKPLGNSTRLDFKAAGEFSKVTVVSRREAINAVTDYVRLSV